MLKLKNLSLNLGPTRIFENLHLEIPKGSRNLWIGPSGIGKSSLAKALAGHLKSSTGEVVLGDRVILKPCRDIIYLAQENDLYPWQTIKEHIEFMLSLPRTQTVQPEILNALDLEAAMGMYPHQLSEGMKKRVQILRGLILNPKVLIFDETLSALDKSRAQVIFANCLKYWSSQATILICISHDTEKIPADFFDCTLQFPFWKSS